jgi:hypothetical protein
MNIRPLLSRILFLAGLAAVIIWASLNRDRLGLAALDAWLSGLGLLAPLAYLSDSRAVENGGPVGPIPLAMISCRLGWRNAQTKNEEAQ